MLLQKPLLEFFTEMQSTLDFLLLSARKQPSDIQAGDEVEIDFDSGMIYDHTKGTQYKGQAFPEFMQKIIAAEGLINYINQK